MINLSKQLETPKFNRNLCPHLIALDIMERVLSVKDSLTANPKAYGVFYDKVENSTEPVARYPCMLLA